MFKEQDFIQQYKAIESDLYRVAYIYMKNEADTLDVMQEVAYRAYKYRHQLEQPKYFKTWATRITMNCAHDALRKNGCYVATEQIIETPILDDVSSIELADVMEKLTPKEKDVIILRIFYDYTFQQTAHCLNSNENTVKTIYYRSLRKLKQQLEEGER